MSAETVYSVGHSNHTFDHFLSLLTQHEMEVVADVRTSPFSRYSPQFNRAQLSAALHARGIGYVFLGAELGGRPDGREFYDWEGHVRYDHLARSPLFLDGLQRLLRGAANHRVAMLCSEGDPAQCHRHLLIGRVLDAREVQVVHINADGTLCKYLDVTRQAPVQQTLFSGEEDSEWRSPRSVLPNTAPKSSSGD
jgi:uncharacterized protein (DUF488 family)